MVTAAFSIVGAASAVLFEFHGRGNHIEKMKTEALYKGIGTGN